MKFYVSPFPPFIYSIIHLYLYKLIHFILYLIFHYNPLLLNLCHIWWLEIPSQDGSCIFSTCPHLLLSTSLLFGTINYSRAHPVVSLPKPWTFPLIPKNLWFLLFEKMVFINEGLGGVHCYWGESLILGPPNKQR